MKDTDIIRKVLRGDIESFQLLVEKYHVPVLRFVKNMINDNHICEDIAQDVFLSAYKKLSSFDNHCSNFSTWLFVIARNKSINVLKKKKPSYISEIPQIQDTDEPSEKLIKKEFFNKLDQILDTLPLKQKEAFILAEFEKLPYSRIAEIQGARIGTIKSRINRAKKKLRTVLKGPDGDIL